MSEAKPTSTSWFQRSGPGLITGVADDDPGGIATLSQVGAQFGFNLMWTVALTYTLRRLPEKDRPRGYGTSWPSVVQEAKHAYGYTPEAPMRVIPSAAAISRMEECFDWLMLIHPEDARIVWLRADGMRWRQVCIRAGVVRSNAWRRWAAALLTIAKKLNSQTKTKHKLRVPEPLLPTPRAIPRESVVNTQDNPQNTLNFRRDISSSSEA